MPKAATLRSCAAKEREVALRDSGLPECAWFRAHETPPVTERAEELIEHGEALERHHPQCATCQAREQYVTRKPSRLIALECNCYGALTRAY